MTLDTTKYLESLHKIRFSIDLLEKKVGLESAISKISCASGIPICAIIVYCSTIFPNHYEYLNNRFKRVKQFYGYNDVIGLDGNIILGDLPNP